MKESHLLEQRVTRLERQNCLLMVALGGLGLLSLLGWQSARKPESLRVTRLEVVDHRGVPLIVLAPGRKDEGGSIVLRDAAGERRSWWESSPDAAAFGMVSGDVNSPSSTLGLSVSSNQATATLLGQGGASLGAEVTRNTPKLELFDSAGRSTFRAPWK